MKNRHLAIVNPKVKELDYCFLKNDFVKITPNFSIAWSKVLEENEEFVTEMTKDFSDENNQIDVHRLSKDSIMELLDVLQATATLVDFVATKRLDFDEILELWKRKQDRRIREYGLNEKDK